MIIENNEIELYKRAGSIAGEAIKYGSSLIKPGAKVVDVLDKIEQFIKEKGGGIAFPAQISLNNTAAHFCPTNDDSTAFKEGDVAKLDLGVHIDGCIADTAVTIDLGNNKELVDASRMALENALKIIKPGIKLKEIGKVIDETIRKHGFVPVRNLSGHGLGKFLIHTSPSIPNYDNNDDYELSENEVIAIEPFASAGRGFVEEKGEPTIFSLTGSGRVRSMYARELLKEISKQSTLPFTERWITRMFGKGKGLIGLRELLRANMIHKYPPLVDTEGLVSQAEHTVIVKGEGNIITTSREN